MTVSNSMNKNRLGFLTIVCDRSESRIGGLLVVNASGRPLEFHCTAPVKPNRAQEILYGPTLGEYLCGEQIGVALCEAIKHPPSLLLTDIPEALSLRPLIDFPLLLSMAETNSSEGVVRRLVQTTRDDQTFAAGKEHEQDLRSVEAVLETVAPGLDLREPFNRIHEAITEAQGGMRKPTAA